MTSPKRRVQELYWYVETGYCDFGGVGRWTSTKESHKFNTEGEALALKSDWLREGKIERMHWGELRPTFDYGLFRIRSEWVTVDD